MAFFGFPFDASTGEWPVRSKGVWVGLSSEAVGSVCVRLDELREWSYLLLGGAFHCSR